MIDQELIDAVGAHLEIGDLKNKLAKDLLNNYIKVIEDNAQLHKQMAKYKNLIEDISALGFLEVSHDSGKSHRDVCNKFKELFPDDEAEL